MRATKYICLIMLLCLLFSCKEKYKIPDAVNVYEEELYKRLLSYYFIEEVSPPKVVEDGILFTFAENYQNVELSGDFINWQYSIPMIKGKYGIFYFLYQKPLKEGKYTYRYRVDGIWINDPLQTNFVFDAKNQNVSYFTLDKDVVYYDLNPIYNKDNTVTFFYKNDNAENVYFALNIYGYDPYGYPMTKTEDNIWKITLALENGDYYYNFIVDREWKIDPVNYNIVYGTDNREHSYVSIRYDALTSN